MVGYFQILDSGYNVIGSVGCGNGYSTDLHDLRILPNGHYLVMGTVGKRTDMSQIAPGGDSAAYLVEYIMQELDLEKNVIFEFRSWEHYNPLSTTDVDLTDTVVDYIHPNALEYDNDGNYLISCRHLEEITKVNHVTGSVIWRLGGKHSDFTFLNDSLHFSHQHCIRRLPNGNITLFDNGNLHKPAFSRALEYSLNEKSLTARLEWQYNEFSNYTFSNAMGDVERLPNGNTFIGWGSIWNSYITATEVSSDGTNELVLRLPNGVRSYRVFRNDWNPTPSGLGVTSAKVSQNVSLAASPNPFTNSTEVGFTLDRNLSTNFVVRDAIGREVMRENFGTLTAGNHTAHFNASRFTSRTLLRYSDHRKSRAADQNDSDALGL